jgi:phosphate transport system permease protein
MTASELKITPLALKHSRFKRRAFKNKIALTLALLAMAFGLFWLLWILGVTLHKGIDGLSAQVFTETTPPPNDAGGLSNALMGSLMMVGLATCFGTPVGMMTGVCLAEYAKHSRFSAIVRFVNDILLSAPSIVIGLFVYAVCVAPMEGFSGLAGAIALSLIVIPIVMRTTENMLNLVPIALREAAYALGTPQYKVVFKITLKSARAGILTGVLLAIARISGETAPLLFTALSNQFWSTDITQPMASLPVTIFKFAMSPYENWQQLAWAGVFIITMAVLLLNIVARLLTRRKI